MAQMSGFAMFRALVVMGGLFALPGGLAPDTVGAACRMVPEERIAHLRAELADVQMDLMRILEVDPATTADLQCREAALKYSLREEQIRRDQSRGQQCG